METNLNCDLGEKSFHYDGRNDQALMQIINTANIACGYHAGNKETMTSTIKIAKENNVSIGAHPGFDDTIEVSSIASSITLRLVGLIFLMKSPSFSGCSLLKSLS